MKGFTAIFGVILWFLLRPSLVDCLGFQLEPNTRKCLRDRIDKNILVSGEYDVLPVAGQTVNLTVVDSKGGLLAKKENASKGRFTFTTDQFEEIEICFMSEVARVQSFSILRMTAAHGSKGVPQEIYLKLKHGVEAKNYEEDPAMKLKPLEIELQRLEDAARELYMRFLISKMYMDEMRDTNEATNARLLFFSILALLSLIGMALGQVIYLRRYFKSKKLMD